MFELVHLVTSVEDFGVVQDCNVCHRDQKINFLQFIFSFIRYVLPNENRSIPKVVATSF